MCIADMKRFLVLLICLLSTRQILTEDQEDSKNWSWNNHDEQLTEPFKLEDALTSETIEQPVVNATNIEDVVDAILDSSRQGRNLKEFDEVYTDPSLQEAIQNGDDNEARNLIRDKLCGLGLIQVNNFTIIYLCMYLISHNIAYFSVRNMYKESDHTLPLKIWFTHNRYL